MAHRPLVPKQSVHKTKFACTHLLRDEIKSFGKFAILYSYKIAWLPSPLFLSWTEFYQYCYIHISYLLRGSGLCQTLLCSKPILSCFMQKCYLVHYFFKKHPQTPSLPPILYKYKIANLPELLISSLRNINLNYLWKGLGLSHRSHVYPCLVLLILPEYSRPSAVVLHSAPKKTVNGDYRHWERDPASLGILLGLRNMHITCILIWIEM